MPIISCAHNFKMVVHTYTEWVSKNHGQSNLLTKVLSPIYTTMYFFGAQTGN